tara:strand:+ start:7367 stop:7822 length:456 start_codon:yes stop_codon:yes gene_type:complete
MKTIFKNSFRGFVILATVITLSACSSSIDLNVDADNTVNPDMNNQSLPVLVKVYQLRDDKAFKQASFDGLWKNYQQTLGKSLVSEKNITAMPNATKTISINYNEDAKYIGFVAVFRERNGDTWKAVLPIPGVAVFGRDYDITLHGDTMDVE